MLKLVSFTKEDGSKELTRASKTEGRSIIMVGHKSFSNVGGAFFKSSRRAIINIPTEMLEDLNLSDGCDINSQLEGLGLNAVEIVRKESLTPFYEGQQPKVNPSTNEVVKTSDGQAIYMKDDAYDVGTEKDSLIPSAGQSAEAEATQPVAEEGDHA